MFFKLVYGHYLIIYTLCAGLDWHLKEYKAVTPLTN